MSVTWGKPSLAERIRASYYAEVPSKTPWTFDHEDYDLAAPMVKDYDESPKLVAAIWIAIGVVGVAVIAYLFYFFSHWNH